MFSEPRIEDIPLPARVEKALAMLGVGLKLMRAERDKRDRLSAEVALKLQTILGPKELEWFAATAIKAMPEDAFERMVFDLGGPPPLGITSEENRSANGNGVHTKDASQ